MSGHGIRSMGKDRIIKNAIALFLGNGIGNLLSFFLMVVIARSLGDVGVGQYSFIFAFGSLILLLGNPGLEYLIVRRCLETKDCFQCTREIYSP